MKTWVKLYTESNEDPKIGSLTWAQRGIWAALLALAGRLDHRDQDGIETGLLDTPENTAWHLRCPQDELDIALVAFQERGMIAEADGLLYIANYTKRQRRAPSASREAVAERVQRYREAQAEDDNGDEENGNEAVTTLQENVTPLDTETEESRIETEKEKMPAADAATPPEPSPKPPPKRKKPKAVSKPVPEAVKVFQQNAHRYPAKAWYDRVAEAVGEKPADLERWGALVLEWVGRGWNPTNVAGMLDAFKNGGLKAGPKQTAPGKSGPDRWLEKRQQAGMAQ